MRTITSIPCKARISILSILMGIGLFFTSSIYAANVIWVGAATGDWATGTNWSGGVIPGATDSVTITSPNVVTLSSDAGKINKLKVHGKLIIDANGILNIEQSVAYITGGNKAILEINGGEVQNAGSLTIKETLSSVDNYAIKFTDGATIASTKLTNTGILTIDLTARTLTTTASISFAHSTANGKTAQFVLGGTININVLVQSRIFELTSGNAIFDGTYTFGSTSDYKNWRFMQYIAGNFTIAPTGNIEIYSGYNVSGGGTISSSNSKEVIITNNGTFALHGGSTLASYGIYMNPQFASYNLTINNYGTFTVDGTFPGGAIFMSGASVAVKNSFNNKAGATATIGNTSAAAGALVASSTAAITNEFNNAGAISFNSASSKNVYFGGSNSTFNNTGTVNLTKAFTGNSTTLASVVNNNAGGVFNFNVSDNAQVAISNANKIIFNNNSGATINGKGLFGAGTFFPQDGGIVSPGGDSGVGIFTFLDPTMVMKGICKMNINGTAVAGTDYDQIYTNQTGSVLNVANVNLEAIIGSGYSPTNLDAVPLFSSLGTVTGTFLSVTAPSKWVANYTTSAAKLLYDTSTGIVNKADFKGSVSAQGQQISVNLPSQVKAHMQITDLTGKTILTQLLNSEKNNVNTSLKGIYFVCLVMPTGTYTQKVLLN